MMMMMLSCSPTTIPATPRHGMENAMPSDLSRLLTPVLRRWQLLGTAMLTMWYSKMKSYLWLTIGSLGLSRCSKATSLVRTVWCMAKGCGAGQWGCDQPSVWHVCACCRLGCKQYQGKGVRVHHSHGHPAPRADLHLLSERPHAQCAPSTGMVGRGRQDPWR